MDLSALLAATTLEHQVPADQSVDANHQHASSPVFGFISQAACHLHRYTRNDSDAHIVERADRLRSVFMGVAIAHGRLTSTKSGKATEMDGTKSAEVSDLEKLLGGMNIGSGQNISEGWPFTITSTSRRMKLDSPAVQFVHGTEYATKLCAYIADVPRRHANKESEVPEPLSQGDLYLCQESLEALEGAIGACCEAVDQICTEKSLQGARRFVSIRPPGHHCESDNPMGFCWLNNVAVAAAHAHLEHGIDRVVILDIDLHHGNGTQEIAWRLNALAHKTVRDRQKPASPRKGSPKKAAPHVESLPILQIFYGSLHDIDSYPCEELDPILIANASVNISGGGGSQFITNVHLEPYESLEDFHQRLYPGYMSQLIGPAKAFLRKTKGDPSKTLIIVSAGFDASEHEYASMSRHGARVPSSFFSRFARDALAFAETEASGKLLAVLEGGYSQRALCSGAGSFVSGLADTSELSREDMDSWWTATLLEEYEKLLNPSSSRGKKVAPAVKKEIPDQVGDWRAPSLAVYSKLASTIPQKPAAPKTKEKAITPPSSNVRTTRSRYNTPAPAVKTVSVNDKVFASSASPTVNHVPGAPAATPDSSPSAGRNVSHANFPPAAPLIRFTFKAGDTKAALPEYATGTYRDRESAEAISKDEESSTSE